MKRRYAILISGVVVLLAAVIGLLVYVAQEEEVDDRQGTRTISPRSVKSRVHLYFSDEVNGYLVAEERNLSMPEDPVQRSKRLVQALIDGPGTELRPTIPPKTTLRALYVSEKGVAYVDFNQAVQTEHRGGTLAELLTIYSVVNTLCLNIPEIHAVKILIEGHEKKTLSGHIDTQEPFKANLLMLKE